ncbi:nascent polypeptide-associated complex protein [Candidatus Woesearchaeota archaeon]|nr:nascent polypeptide-associated complex protein [Candidatus Woesearchaeota archaeon]
MFPNMNPKSIQAAMKKMGIQQQELLAKEVIIKQNDKTLIIRNPEILKVNMMGQISLQITGNIEELKEEILQEDIKTVAEQAEVSEEEAKQALKQTKGDLAEAILLLKK